MAKSLLAHWTLLCYANSNFGQDDYEDALKLSTNAISLGIDYSKREKNGEANVGSLFLVIRMNSI
jgi:hypothetical protein